MSVIAWLGVVSAIIGILAFMFSIWVWITSDRKVRELQGVIQTAYDIAGNIKWETQIIIPEDSAARLRNAEDALGKVSALHEMTGQYAKSPASFRETEIGALLERGVIWTTATIWDIEKAAKVREIWLVTPDLEPDLSNTSTGEVVAKNLKSRKRYVYFCPNNIRNFENEKRRLLSNIGALRSQESSRVTVVPVGPEVAGGIFQRGNTIIYFFEDPEWGAYSAFEEIVFTKVSKRGVFWQEHTPEVAAKIRETLKEQLQNWRAKPSS